MGDLCNPCNPGMKNGTRIDYIRDHIMFVVGETLIDV